MPPNREFLSCLPESERFSTLRHRVEVVIFQAADLQVYLRWGKRKKLPPMLLWVRRRLLLRALLLFSWSTSEASFSRGTLLTMAAAGSSTLASASSKTHTNECDSHTVHLIVLVHGWKGDSKEMGYMKRSLLRESEKHPSSRFVVHSSTVNEGRTSDGIAAGGERLAAEVSDMIASHRADDNVVTLSFVGNSLGGLYSRYAISKIDSSAVEPIVFCTTATPHLGVSNHTYVPIPRSVEWVVAHVMHSTGKDLFQYTPIIKDMAFNSTFKTPLQRFRKRIAYANVSSCDNSGNTSLVTSCTYTQRPICFAGVRHGLSSSYIHSGIPLAG